MTQQPAPAIAPVQIDRVLRSTSGNANFTCDEGSGVTWPPQAPYESDDEDSDSDCLLKPSLVTDQHAATAHGQRAARHAAERAARKRNQKFIQPSQRPERIFAQQGELPNHLYVAYFRHKQTKEVRCKIRPIPEALVEEERYQQYKIRPRKDLGKDGKPVWPPHMEDAFQIAVRRVPPVLGKKKVNMPSDEGGERPSGRNELISRVLLKLTGETRLRKQISSHKQVLRNFIGGSVKPDKDSDWDETQGPQTWQWDEAKARLVCVDPDIETEGIHIKSEYRPKGSRPNAMLRYGSGSAPSSLEVAIQRMDFNMSRYTNTSRDPDEERLERTHTYTTMQTETGAEPRWLEQLQDWRGYFPDLGTFMDRGDVRRCDIILLESTLSLGTLQPSRSAVGIDFNVFVGCTTGFDQWEIRTTFYENIGEMKASYSKAVKSRHNDVTKTTSLLDMGLNAPWWMKVFHRIIKRRKDIERLHDERMAEYVLEDGTIAPESIEAHKMAQATLAQEDKNSCRYLREMSVMQEIYISKRDRLGNRIPQRVAIFLWTFRRAQAGETATTVWRRLRQPPSRNTTNSPLPPYPQPPMVLDTRVNQIIDGSAPDTGSGIMDPFSGQTSWEQPDWSTLTPHEVLTRMADPLLSYTAPGYRDQFHSQYLDPTQERFHQSSSTVPSNAQQHSDFASQITPFSSDYSSQQTDQSQSQNLLSHESLNQASNVYHANVKDDNQGNNNFAIHDLQLHGHDPNIHHSDNLNFACHEMPDYGAPATANEDFSFPAVTDPNLLADFSGGHVQLSFQNPEAALSQTQLEIPPYMTAHTQPGGHTYDQNHPTEQGHQSFNSNVHRYQSNLQPVSLQHSEPHTPAFAPPPDHTSLNSTPTMCLDGASHSTRRDPDLYADGDLLVHLARGGDVDFHQNQYPHSDPYQHQFPYQQPEQHPHHFNFTIQHALPEVGSISKAPNLPIEAFSHPDPNNLGVEGIDHALAHEVPVLGHETYAEVEDRQHAAMIAEMASPTRPSGRVHVRKKFLESIAWIQTRMAQVTTSLYPSSTRAGAESPHAHAYPRGVALMEASTSDDRALDVCAEALLAYAESGSRAVLIKQLRDVINAFEGEWMRDLVRTLVCAPVVELDEAVQGLVECNGGRRKFIARDGDTKVKTEEQDRGRGLSHDGAGSAEEQRGLPPFESAVWSASGLPPGLFLDIGAGKNEGMPRRNGGRDASGGSGTGMDGGEPGRTCAGSDDQRVGDQIDYGRVGLNGDFHCQGGGLESVQVQRGRHHGDAMDFGYEPF